MLSPIRFTAGIVLLLLAACSTPQRGLFEKKTPHEKYKDGLDKAGLSNTRLGLLWRSSANSSLAQPLRVTIPYKETGYFENDKPGAAGYVFAARQGDQLSLLINTNPANGFLLFCELWEIKGNDRKLIAGGDTVTNTISYEVKKDGDYIVRLQPELLQGVAYTITINTGPSLAFPVNRQHNPKVISVWGDSRDANKRLHEGIDIGAKKLTPIVASADGRVTTVREGGIGGKIIFMRPSGKNYNLYYAHLDTQMVQSGQLVGSGDTLGLIGNTGNAKGTVPHLHFGIYGDGGAVDPLPFVNISRPLPKIVKADTGRLGSFANIKGITALYSELSKDGIQKITLSGNELVRLIAATDDFYKVQLTDSTVGFVKVATVNMRPLRQQSLTNGAPLLDAPLAGAAIKKQLIKGTNLQVLGMFKNYAYVIAGEINGWVKML